MYVFGYEEYRLKQAQGLWDTPWLRGSQESEGCSVGSIYKGAGYSKRDMLTSALRQDDVATDVYHNLPGVRAPPTQALVVPGHMPGELSSSLGNSAEESGALRDSGSDETRPLSQSTAADEHRRSVHEI